eukprot:365535-Chlamydomonas_euryale.AAC.41
MVRSARGSATPARPRLRTRLSCDRLSVFLNRPLRFHFPCACPRRRTAHRRRASAGAADIRQRIRALERCRCTRVRHRRGCHLSGVAPRRDNGRGGVGSGAWSRRRLHQPVELQA